MKRAVYAAIVMILAPSFLAAQKAQVLTQHNDNARSGAMLAESKLTVASVSSGNFGLMYALPVDGQIYAQPLYVGGLEGSVNRLPVGTAAIGIGFNGRHNVLYVATMHDSVYAFDADDPNGGVLWHRQLGTPVARNFMPLAQAAASMDLGTVVGQLLNVAFEVELTDVCKAPTPMANQTSFNIDPEIGITSTPVVDLGSSTIYVVAKTTEPQGYAYRLHALDLRSGAERPRSPLLIQGSVSGGGTNAVNGTLTFDPKTQLQRPALLFANGMVYVAFGAHQDTSPYHGWIFAYDALLQNQPLVFATTPNGADGGIWQSGNGPVADAASNIYVMTGNGTFNRASGGTELSDSFVKLDSRLNIIDYFTPKDYQDMQRSDVDLGSAGPLLLPGQTVLGGGKKGVFYLLDQANLGQLEGDHNHPLQSFQATQGVDNTIVDAVGAALMAAAAVNLLTDNPVQAAVEFGAANLAFSTDLCGLDNHHIHGSPVTWYSPKEGPLVYVWGERDVLRAFKFDPSTRRFPSESPTHESGMKDPDDSNPGHKFMPGAILSLSANASTAGTGILWASLPATGNALDQVTGGELRAFDAEDVGHALWCDGVGKFAKFAAPTIADGKVYLATFDHNVNVYGLSGEGKGSNSNGNLGGYKTKSPPVVADGYVYFQGEGSGDADNRLYKVSVTNPNGDNTWLGGYKTKSSPFVADGYVYFQASGSGDRDNRLYKVSVTNPNGDNTWLGGYKAKSSPFVAGGYVYFQGSGSGDKDNRLYKVSVTNPNGDNTWLGGYKAKSSPFVAGGYVYFQGSGSGDKDNRLYKVSVTNPNGDNTWLGGYKAKSPPFVTGGYAYFERSDDALYKVSVTDPNGDNAGLGYNTKSSPFVAGNYVYFQGKDGSSDNALWRVFDDGTRGGVPGCSTKTKSTPFVSGGRIYFQGTDDRLLSVAN